MAIHPYGTRQGFFVPDGPQNDRFQQNVAVMLNNLIQSTELIQQMFIFIYCFTWERYTNKNESLIKGMTIPNIVIIYPDHPVILSKK